MYDNMLFEHHKKYFRLYLRIGLNQCSYQTPDNQTLKLRYTSILLPYQHGLNSAVQGICLSIGCPVIVIFFKKTEIPGGTVPVGSVKDDHRGY